MFYCEQRFAQNSFHRERIGIGGSQGVRMTLIDKRAWVRRPHIAVLIAFCALGFDVVLAEEPCMPGIEGRWENAKQDLVLDVSRCGERYFGRIVRSGDQCAQTVLTVSRKAASAQDS